MTRASIGPPARCGESIFAPEAGRDSAPERVIYAQDRATGLKAIISVHSTALGPAYGGTRFFPYGDEQAALTDVLNLGLNGDRNSSCVLLPEGSHFKSCHATRGPSPSRR